MLNREREILRGLAAEFRELTDTREMEELRAAWYRHNDLQTGKPLVVCFPEGSFDELVGDKDLRCEDPYARKWELQLRRNLYRIRVFRDDSAFDPALYIGLPISDDGFGVNIPKTYGENRGSYTWTPPLKNLGEEELTRIHPRRYTFDRAAFERETAYAADTLGDILEVRQDPQLPCWSMGLTRWAIQLIGLEGMMVQMVDDPEGVEALMELLRRDGQNFLDMMTREGLWAPNRRDGYTGSGGIAYTHRLEGEGQMSCWGFSESQETVGVSPRMYGHLVFPYELELLQGFGLNCYGCCEGVHQRIRLIERIPRLGRVSVSPWCEQEIMGEFLRGRAVFSRKPNPAMIAVRFHEEEIRQDIRTTLEASRGCNVEFIMKDVHTVQYDARRIPEWVRIAKEEVEAFAR
ncbi:MAG: hypothetical protein ACOX17_09180 [Christensenellales bacterium]